MQCWRTFIGAVINMEPELYKGVAAHVPFVDVVTTMLDESIPLTTNEYDEWGNPNNKDSYEYMLSYSPYDQVKAQAYPHMLVTTGLHDSQVQYFEPAKWVAKLRDMKTDDNVLAFHTNMEAGHGGSSGRFRRNKDRALEYAFFSHLAGIKQTEEISSKPMDKTKVRFWLRCLLSYERRLFCFHTIFSCKKKLASFSLSISMTRHL